MSSSKPLRAVAGAETWGVRLGARFDPNGPVAHRARLSSFKNAEPKPSAVALPPKVDLRKGFPEVTRQIYNSCTAEALVASYAFLAMAQNGPQSYVESSRLFVYYTERLADGMDGQDAGAYISTGIQSLIGSGVCEEKFHSYSLGPFVRPDRSAFADALDHKVLTARYVEQNLEGIRTLLAGGNPIVIGFLVYPSIQSAVVETTGDIPLPSEAEKRVEPIGGHAVVLVGYDDSTQKFILRNSWGTDWGDSGHGTIPYAYVLDFYLCQDNWVILTVDDSALTPGPPVPTPGPTPVPEPSPTPVPVPPQPNPNPAPGPDCCSTCEPYYCCCARTRVDPVPTPGPIPVPTPFPTPPQPSPTPNPPVPPPFSECCVTCDPNYCCCARTRMAAYGRRGLVAVPIRLSSSPQWYYGSPAYFRQ